MYNQQPQYQQPGYGQPPPNMQLPFSETQLQWPINQLGYGQAPVQMQIQCSPQLQNYVPLILNQLATAIQETATQNKLRTFLFNQMANQQFNNEEFYRLATMTAEVVELVMLTTPGAQIESAIQKTTRQVVLFVTALNAIKFPGLTQGLAPQDLANIQATTEGFNREVAAMKQSLQPPPQQGGWGQPNQWQQPQPNQGGWGVPQQPQFGAGHPAGNQGYGGSALPPVPTSPPAWRGRAVNNTPVKPVANIRVEATVIPTGRKTFRSGQIPAASMPFTRAPEPVAPVVPTIIAPKTDVDIYDASGLSWLLTQGLSPIEFWKSSKEFPFTYAYNPTLYTLNNLVDTQGNVRSVLVTKEPIPMDRTAHLSAPKIAPAWTIPVLAESVTMDKYDRKMAIAHEDLVYVKYPEGISHAASPDEHWTLATTYLGAILIDQHAKRQVIRLGGVIVEPVVCNPIFKMWLSDLSKHTSPKWVHSALLSLMEEAGYRSERHDIQLVNRINKLLTNRINRFIKNELALSSGTIDSFLVDGLAIVPYLEKKFGMSVVDTFMTAFPDMVTGCLSFYEKEEQVDVVDYYCSGFMKELGGPTGDRELITFYQHNEYALVDLSSIELQVDLGSTGVAVGVKESLTPLFYGLCEALLGEHDYEDGAKEIVRYYIRTNDDLTFEVNRGAINKDFFLVSLAK